MDLDFKKLCIMVLGGCEWVQFASDPNENLNLADLE